MRVKNFLNCVFSLFFLSKAAKCYKLKAKKITILHNCDKDQTMSIWRGKRKDDKIIQKFIEL